MVKNGFKWLFFEMEKTHKFINVRMSARTFINKHFPVCSIT